ncbi:hypothetical protein DOZ58_08530 [Acetobacterium sp. KB-1]|jgi:hypothetical protein|nr:hypothetical protein DOZ58_08530 [Acetobacterium sp. KB-1]
MSWELLGSDRMIKTTELSDFVNTEMTIPKERISFFGNPGERLAIIYQNREYPSYLETEGDTKLKWSKVLIRKLGEAFPDFESWFQGDPDASKTPKLEIIKANEVFHLRLIMADEENSDEKISDMPIIATPPTAGLQELLLKWITGYPNYYPRDFRFSFKETITEEIPKVIENLKTIRSGHYQVRGFAGDTQWAEIPWVKVRDKQALDDSDLYLAYLLAMDSRKLYLAIVYGEEGMGVRSLAEKAAAYRKNLVTEHYRTNHKDVLLANASLVSGIVCYREYTETEMPEDEVLIAEFEAFRKMYKLCLTKGQTADETAVSDEPSEEIIKGQDAKVENEMIAEIKQKPEVVLEEQTPPPQGSQPVPAETVLFESIGEERPGVENKNQAESGSEAPAQPKHAAISTLREVVMAESETNLSSADVDDIQFKAETKAAESKSFTRYPAKNDYLPPYLQLVQVKMGDKGYYYPAELIKTYYLSIKSKPFVIIKGQVGSGKTSFPRLFAEAIGANQENGRFKRLLVGKNWEDHTPLLGHLDSRGHFIPGPIMLILKAAKEYPDKPHFFMLDEMDQSPAADYLRLLLEGINGSKEPFLKREDFGADITAFREYGNLSFPDNLYIVATINEGPDSFPVHSRVIDSGNVIRMPVVEIGVFADYGSPTGDSDWENSVFKIHSQAKGLPEILERLMVLLNEVQQLLIKHECPMGYRGKNEILAFGINSGVEGLYSELEVIDLALLQRIIPALEAVSETDVDVYLSLAGFLLEDGLKQAFSNLPPDRLIGRYEALLKAGAIPCPRSGGVILKRLRQQHKQ